MLETCSLPIFHANTKKLKKFVTKLQNLVKGPHVLRFQIGLIFRNFLRKEEEEGNFYLDGIMAGFPHTKHAEEMPSELGLFA